MNDNAVDVIKEEIQKLEQELAGLTNDIAYSRLAVGFGEMPKDKQMAIVLGKLNICERLIRRLS